MRSIRGPDPSEQLERIVGLIQAGDFRNVSPAELGKIFLELAQALRENYDATFPHVGFRGLSGEEARKALDGLFKAARRRGARRRRWKDTIPTMIRMTAGDQVLPFVAKAEKLAKARGVTVRKALEQLLTLEARRKALEQGLTEAEAPIDGYVRMRLDPLMNVYHSGKTTAARRRALGLVSPRTARRLRKN